MANRTATVITVVIGVVFSVFVLIALRITAYSPAEVDTTRPGWRLVFSDEFNNADLDRSKWQTQYWHGRTNYPELQYYADNSFTFSDGMVHITASERSIENMRYASGLISSQNHYTFTYGYAEIRAKVPHGQGLWPAFWLVTEGKVRRPEIDVLELLGHDTQTVYTTAHYRDDDGAIQDVGHSVSVPDLSAGFHTFAVDWSPEALIWFVDGIECYRITEHIPDEPMYMIANLAVGGTWPGDPDESTSFPAQFDVDSIRVYQR